ncbi:hypothetical protein C8J56DRAFT_920726 [Mycena floridula]|nr:hypothetical protein C8J56DRAFT_920726 [Mycena floridula]
MSCANHDTTVTPILTQASSSSFDSAFLDSVSLSSSKAMPWKTPYFNEPSNWRDISPDNPLIHQLDSNPYGPSIVIWNANAKWHTVDDEVVAQDRADKSQSSDLSTHSASFSHLAADNRPKPLPVGSSRVIYSPRELVKPFPESLPFSSNSATSPFTTSPWNNFRKSLQDKVLDDAETNQSSTSSTGFISSIPVIRVERKKCKKCCIKIANRGCNSDQCLRCCLESSEMCNLGVHRPHSTSSSSASPLDSSRLILPPIDRFRKSRRYDGHHGRRMAEMTEMERESQDSSYSRSVVRVEHAHSTTETRPSFHPYRNAFDDDHYESKHPILDESSLTTKETLLELLSASANGIYSHRPIVPQLYIPPITAYPSEYSSSLSTPFLSPNMGSASPSSLV